MSNLRTSRRAHLTLLAAAVLAALSLAACGGSGSTGGAASSSSSGSSNGAVSGIPNVVTTPARSGPMSRVNWGVEYEPSSLDWTLDYSSVENETVSNITESLLRLDPDFTVEPSLATSWKHPNPTTWIFELRPGVKFSDGNPLTAQDVVYSLNRNRAAASYWATWLTYVKDVNQTGPEQVTVTLTKPDALFLQMMALPAGGVGEKSYIEAKGKAYGTSTGLPVGTGPFKVTSWIPGSSITMVPNPYYWDAQHKAEVQRLVFSFVTDESSMVSALQSGQLDGAYFVPYSGVPLLKSSSVGKLYQGPSMLQTIVLFDGHGPFNNPKLRRAWLLATDRSAIARVVFNGAAQPMANSFVPAATWGYPQAKAIAGQAYAELGPTGVQLAEAKKLVAEAGSPKQTLKVAYRATQQNTDLMTILQAAGTSIGLNIKGIALQPSAFVNLIFSAKAREPYDAWLEDRYYSDIADPLEIMYEFLEPPSNGFVSYNFDNYNNPVVTHDLEQARSTENPAQRADLTAKAQAAMANDVPVMPLVVPDSLVFLNKRITGAPASFSYLYYPWARDLGAS